MIPSGSAGLSANLRILWLPPASSCSGWNPESGQVSHVTKLAGFFNFRMTGGSLAAVTTSRLTEPGCPIAGRFAIHGYPAAVRRLSKQANIPTCHEMVNRAGILVTQRPRPEATPSARPIKGRRQEHRQARYVAGDSVARPASLPEIVAGGATNGIVFAAPNDLRQELGDHGAVRRVLDVLAESPPAEVIDNLDFLVRVVIAEERNCTTGW